MKKIWNQIKAFFKKNKSQIWRALPFMILAYIAYQIFVPSPEEMKLFYFMIRCELLAFFLTLLVQWGFTKVDFTSRENVPALGRIFIGVHVLLGFATYGYMSTLSSSV